MHFSEIEIQCPSCGEALSVPFDPSEGEEQSFIEDCSVCCRPIQIRVKWDFESNDTNVEVLAS